MHVVTVVDAKLEGAVEDAIVAGEEHFAHVDAELVGDDAGDIVDESAAVDAGEADGSIEKEAALHVPLHVKDTVAVAGLQLVGHGACPLMDFYAVLTV